MQSVTLTVHEALCEIKVNTKRIASTINKSSFCTFNRASSSKLNGSDISVYEKEAQSNYNSIVDLIKRTEAMKAAISLSNASTFITVGGRKMSVAEGIYYLSHGVDDKKQLLKVLTEQLVYATSKIEQENGDKLDKKVENFVITTFGSKEKADATEINQVTENYRRANSLVLIDPLNIREKIKSLQEEIDAFEKNIDSALQVSNATTTITFEY